MVNRKTTHIVTGKNGGWSVKRSGSQRAFKRFETKKEAVKYGRQLSKERKSEFIIHRKDGTIQDADSHGSVPRPLRDKSSRGSIKVIGQMHLWIQVIFFFQTVDILPGLWYRIFLRIRLKRVCKEETAPEAETC